MGGKIELTNEQLFKVVIIAIVIILISSGILSVLIFSRGSKCIQNPSKYLFDYFKKYGEEINCYCIAGNNLITFNNETIKVERRVELGG